MSRSHLINANIHRAKEGSRVLEDISRFILRNESLFHQLRAIRHGIEIAEPIYDATKDLGGPSLLEDNIRPNLLSMIQANAIRVQEALRVLEEIAGVDTNKQLMKQLRYQMYELHSKLYYSARKHLQLHLLQGLYLIIDTDIIPYPLEKIIHIINQSAVNLVQYRNKTNSKKVVAENAYKIRQQLEPNKLLIINDHIDVALDVGNGVHIGQEDYPVDRIRCIIPEHFILGVSCDNPDQIEGAVQSDVSYIAVGSVFKTQSKKNVKTVPIDELQKICKKTDIPVCAIGGMNCENLDQALTADIKMAALISSVWHTDNPIKIINHMHEKIIHRQATSQLHGCVSGAKKAQDLY